MNEKEIKVAELFCGIGGFRCAFEQANRSFQSDVRTYKSEHQRENTASEVCLDTGWNKPKTSYPNYKVVWANDNNKYACQIYRHRYGNKELVEGDIREVKTDTVPDIDLLCAGNPCVSFSYAGKRKGIEDSRGALFAQIIRVASAKKPKILLLENVKGLLSSSNGGDFAKVIRCLGNLGYILQWQVFNSVNFSVPQLRERVYVVGHLGEECFTQIFPLEKDEGESLSEVADVPKKRSRVRSNRSFITRTLSGRYYKGGEEILVALQHSHSGEGGKGRGFRFYDKGVVPALTRAMGTGGNNVPLLISPDIEARKLTPLECERLQSFPDQWTQFGVDASGKTVAMSDTQRYEKLGNAVTVNVVRVIAEQLLLHM